MLALGTKAPHFSLPDTVSEKTVSFSKLKGEKATIVLFICNHCPFVIHINKELVKLANNYINKGVKCIAISSNDVVSYPQDAPDLMQIHAKNNNYPFPYLYDENQEVAKQYKAACTPDFYIFNEEEKLVYRGQLDGSRPGNKIRVTGADLRNTLDNMLQNKPINLVQKPSIGCNIKWKLAQEL